jgi:paraquat-inducible protein B
VRRRRFSFGWLLPLVGLAVLAYFGFWAWEQNQSNLTLNVKDASGIKAFQTPVLCRGVEVGSVTGITLKPRGGGAVVSIRLDEAALPLATADASWWITRPQFSLTSVQGIESLLAGPSIEFRPGDEPPARRFEALDSPPTDGGATDGLRVYLRAADRGPVEAGTPLHYRGMPVGRVVAMGLPARAQEVIFVCEIDRPYAHLIRENTLFWHRERANAYITRVSLGLEGYKIEFPRLNSALSISIDLATPDDAGPPAVSSQTYDLRETPPENHRDWTPDLTPTTRQLEPLSPPTPEEDAAEPDAPAAEALEANDPVGDLFRFLNPFD